MMQQILAKRVKAGDLIHDRWAGDLTVGSVTFDASEGVIWGVGVKDRRSYDIKVIPRSPVIVLQLAPRTPLEELQMVWDRFAPVELGQQDDHSLGWQVWESNQAATIQDLYNAVLKVMSTPPEVE